MNTLPHGFQLRHPTMNDLQGVTDLLIACEIADYGQPTSSRAIREEAIRSDWLSLETDLAKNAWVVLAPDGSYAGRTDLMVPLDAPEKMHAVPRVSPNYRGLGIGTFLIRLAEQRAREIMTPLPQEKRVTLNSRVEGVNEDAKALLLREGFTPLRTFFRMEIDILEPPPVPQWPVGITVRTFVQRQDERSVFEAEEEIFQHDEWGYTPANFDEWVRSGTGNASFDPSLWFLAIAENEIAGCSLCHLNIGEQINMGFVNTLGVRRKWRKQGLGLALLYHSFDEFYKRGFHQAALSVDSENSTGAVRLYIRAGMRRAKKYDVRYEKVLKEGTL